MYELLYMRGHEVRSKLYEDRNAFVKDFQTLEKSGLPCKAQGSSKAGGVAVVTRNGWDDDDVILTAEVEFSSGRKYSYSAGKRYSGLYEVLTKYGQETVNVTYKWRQIDEFRADLWELGYDNPVSFEFVMVKKVKTM